MNTRLSNEVSIRDFKRRAISYLSWMVNTWALVAFYLFCFVRIEYCIMHLVKKKTPTVSQRKPHAGFSHWLPVGLP